MKYKTCLCCNCYWGVGDLEDGCMIECACPEINLLGRSHWVAYGTAKHCPQFLSFFNMKKNRI